MQLEFKKHNIAGSFEKCLSERGYFLWTYRQKQTQTVKIKHRL